MAVLRVGALAAMRCAGVTRAVRGPQTGSLLRRWQSGPSRPRAAPATAAAQPRAAPRAAPVGDSSEDSKKMGWKEMAKKYGVLGVAVIYVEYIAVGVLIYVALECTSLAAQLTDYFGAERVASWKAWLESLPLVGGYIESMHTDTVTNAILALLLDEITWLFRAPFVIASVPWIAKRLRR